MKKRVMAFVYAFKGISLLIQEIHFRFHTILTILLCSYAYYINLSFEKWLWLISAIVIVLIAEGMNSLVERMCDLVDESYNERIKSIKDIAAGLVLIAAFYSIFIGVYVFFY